jgi:hypothetical protein
MRLSVAMTGAVAGGLAAHLARTDGQEDITLATYRPSTGVERRTAILRLIELPEASEREVHGNASFTGNYVLRVAAAAARDRAGVVVLHSHPGARGWQRMSGPDADAERSFAYLVHEMTGLPLVGMTLATGDGSWSARSWSAEGIPSWCESVRVVDDIMRVSWNDALRPPPAVLSSQLRAVSAWGSKLQADVARLRVLVVGVGSVGLEVALRIAATGVQQVAVMDFDTVEFINLDRLIGATRLDALLGKTKIDVARRLLRQAATAADPVIPGFDLSICESAGFTHALDYDVVFSCVDRPWPRAVLNMLAYSDLIPVIDGGLHIDPFPDEGMRNATWRSHVIRPGRPCMACNRQLDLGLVAVDRDGLLDDPKYIEEAGGAVDPGRENVAALSVSVVASLLSQFVSLAVGPGGFGEPGPLRYLLSTHTLEHLPSMPSNPNCYYESALAVGDQRLDLTGPHPQADRVRSDRAGRAKKMRLVRWIHRTLDAGLVGLDSYVGRSPARH